MGEPTPLNNVFTLWHSPWISVYDNLMAHQILLAPLLSGVAALLLGIVPGAIDGAMEAIIEFSAVLTFSPTSQGPPSPSTTTHRLWFIAIGATLILLSAAVSLLDIQ